MLEVGINAFVLMDGGGVGASAFKANDKIGWALAGGGRVTVLEATVALGEGRSTDEFLASDIFAIHMDTALENKLGC